MNTEVNYEIAKLLAEKGFPQNNIKYGAISTIGKDDNNDLVFGETYACPNISQVVMWLYEKHGIWISVDFNPDIDRFFYVLRRRLHRIRLNTNVDYFKLPTEAYESAITYILTNLI